ARLERLCHSLQLAAQDRLEPRAHLRADVARANGEPEDLAVDLIDRVARNVVHRRDQHSSSTSSIDLTRSPCHPLTSRHGDDAPSGRKSTGVIPTRRAPASSSFAPSPTKKQSAGS